MSSEMLAMTAAAERTFPAEEVKRRLREELRQAAHESATLRPAWQPLLDSVRMVSAVVALERLFPFKLPPEKMVRRGGYGNEDEGVADMFARLQRLWNEHHESEVHS